MNLLYFEEMLFKKALPQTPTKTIIKNNNKNIKFIFVGVRRKHFY